MKAFIGVYYKTLKAAIEAYNKKSRWYRDNHSVVEFKDCFMIVSNEQIRALGGTL